MKNDGIDLSIIQNGIVEETNEFYILKPINKESDINPKDQTSIINKKEDLEVCEACDYHIMSIFNHYCDICSFKPSRDFLFNKEEFKQHLMDLGYVFLSPRLFFEKNKNG